MDLNGSVSAKNTADPPTLRGVAAGTATGKDGENKQGVLSFGNGFKVQWNTVDVDADTPTEFALPEAYTEAQYGVIGCYGEPTGLSATPTSVHISVAASPNNLSHVRIYQIHSTSGTFTQVTYISFGKDAA